MKKEPLFEKVPYLPSYEALRGILLYPSERLSDSLHSMQLGSGEDTLPLSEKDQELILTIEGKPLPKARARTVRRGNFMATYDPQEKEKQAFKQKLKVEFDRQSNTQMKALNFELEAIYHVDLTFHMEITKSCSNQEKTAKFWMLECHTSKPDLDNLEKFVLDCANGILFPDDSQIIQLSSRKFYSKTPKTVIKVTNMRKTDLHKSAEKIITLFSPDEFVNLINDMKILVELSDDGRSLQQGPQLVAFCELAANQLSKIMQKHSEKLFKVSKVKYDLQEKEIRDRREILYGCAHVR